MNSSDYYFKENKKDSETFNLSLFYSAEPFNQKNILHHHF